MAEIEVNEELINSVLSNEHEEAAPAEQAAEQKRGVQMAERTLTYIVSTLDTLAKDRGLPGLGDVTPAQYSELVVIVGEKYLSDDVLAKSPETALILLTGGIFANNLLIYNKLKKEMKEDGGNKDS